MNTIQAHIYSTVDTAVSLEVFSFVPQDQSFPFVVVEPVNVNQEDTSTETAYKAMFSVRIFSTDRTTFNISNIQDSIFTALHHTKVDLTGFAIVSIQQQIRNIQSDGDIHIGYQRFRLNYEEI
jgi:hypothetical protein